MGALVLSEFVPRARLDQLRREQLDRRMSEALAYSRGADDAFTAAAYELRRVGSVLPRLVLERLVDGLVQDAVGREAAALLAADTRHLADDDLARLFAALVVRRAEREL